MKQDKYNDVTGYILAGGKSTRMRSDKKWIKIGGYTLFERTYRLLSDILMRSPLAVCSNPGENLPVPCKILTDKIPNIGPLGGLLAALEACPTEWTLVLAVDMPFITRTEITLLLEAPRTDCEALTLTDSGYPEPMAALYKKSTFPFWLDRADRQKYKMRSGVVRLKWKPIQIPKDSRALINLNTIDDLEKINEYL